MRCTPAIFPLPSWHDPQRSGELAADWILRGMPRSGERKFVAGYRHRMANNPDGQNSWNHRREGKADADGLIPIPGLKITSEPATLTVIKPRSQAK
jgi:hypothetical protein